VTPICMAGERLSIAAMPGKDVCIAVL
jgi:hypothetical protein